MRYKSNHRGCIDKDNKNKTDNAPNQEPTTECHTLATPNINNSNFIVLLEFIIRCCLKCTF